MFYAHRSSSGTNTLHSCGSILRFHSYAPLLGSILVIARHLRVTQHSVKMSRHWWAVLAEDSEVKKLLPKIWPRVINTPKEKTTERCRCVKSNINSHVKQLLQTIGFVTTDLYAKYIRNRTGNEHWVCNQWFTCEILQKTHWERA